MSLPTDPLALLPLHLADALGEVHYRAADAQQRTDAFARLVAAYPEYAEAMHRVVAQWATEDGAALPKEIGPYRVLALLGRGGYGEVYLAEQSTPIPRRVALKVLKRGMDSVAILRRFQWEQEALAKMSHDAIARIYDAGMSAAGQPWFAMELVEGLSITQYCNTHRLGLRVRLELAIEVCHAVQHAHQKGLVHRDLKPANVLVTASGSRPVPKLIDFGIARALEHRGQGLTESGAVLGTPAYMAPEQVATEEGDIDTRTDVYALGVILYELLTGTLPFAFAVGRTASWLEFRRVLTAESPRRPSQALLGSDVFAATWQRDLVGDLDWIVLKAIAREPNRRYSSAAELAQDLGNYLASQPVLAGPPTAAYRTRKFLQRHRTKVYASLAVVLTALIGAVATIRYAWLASVRANENAQLAQREADARAQAEAQAVKTKDTAERLEKALQDFRNLQGVAVAQRAKSAQAELYPAWPDRIPALQDWCIQDGSKLQSLRRELAVALDSLRSQALPWSPDEQQRDRASHPRRDELAKVEQQRDALRRQVALAGGAPLTVPDLPTGAAERSPVELAMLARMRTGLPSSGRSLYGEEALGLGYARAAAEKARGTAEADGTNWALAWALLDNGQDQAALTLAEKLHADSMAQSTGGFGLQVSLLREALASRAQRLAAAEAECARLAGIVASRRTWSYPPDLAAESFLHDTLTKLAAEVESLLANEAVDVQARLDWAMALRDRGLSSAHPHAPTTWAAARAAIAQSSIYSGAKLDLSDPGLTDLVPLGANPSTGLWEFYHLPSAWDGTSDPLTLPIPALDATGRIEVNGKTGMVFVLLPGGSLPLGSQARDPKAPLYDQDRFGNEEIHSVHLAPFLIAKHEMTQGQWQRLMRWDAARRNPSAYPFGSAIGGINIELSNPVENVAASECERLLSRYGLDLPTEAQWEYAARAGTTSPWTAAKAQLAQSGNFADAVTQRLARTWACEPWNDGFGAHAPVGRFMPNAFGLFDVHGNVSEWCKDPDCPYGSERAGDGLRTSVGPFGQRYHRGGNWANLALKARSAYRGTRVDGPDSTVGVRAVRKIAER